MAYEPFQMPYRITGDEDLSTLARKINAIMEGLTFYVNQLQVYENGTGVPTNELVEANKDSWLAAYNGTINYRTAGAPTNNPVPNSINKEMTASGGLDIKLWWDAYTQGDKPADLLLLFWKKGNASGLGAPTIDDSCIAFNVNTSEASYFEFQGLASEKYYSFGIAAARKTENGLEIGAIQSTNSTPDWQDITQGTPDYIGSIDGKPASTIETVTGSQEKADAAELSANSYTDSQVLAVQQLASDAQATADGKITTFYQAAQPVAEAVGDLWIDTDDGNKLYRWDGVNWVSVQDTGIQDAYTAAGDAQAIADSKIVTFFQDTTPTAETVGDLWVDTDDNNCLYRWNGVSWVSIQDGNIGVLLTETVNYRTLGAPTNNPTPTAIDIDTNQDGSIDIKLSWGAYTQGDNQADMLLLFWKKGIVSGLGAPTVNDSCIAFNVNISDSSFHIFEGLASEKYYSFGLAAARKTENGLEIGAVQSPTTAPDWQDVTNGSPDYLGTVAGVPGDEIAKVPVSVVVADASTTIDSKRADYVVPAGSTSAQTVINQAINSLPNGGRVVLLEGTYIVDGSIALTNSITLEGQGISTVIKVKDGLNANLNVITNGTADYIKVTKLKLDGNKANVVGGTHRGMYIGSCTEGLITECAVENFNDFGIYVAVLTRFNISKNKVKGNKWGIVFGSPMAPGGERNIITENECYENDIGIYVSRSTNNVISHNNCSYNNQHGLKVYYYSNYNLISNNHVENNSQEANNTYDGIHIDDSCDQNTFQGNTVRSTGAIDQRYGIRVNTASCDGNVITNNDLYGSGATASLSDAGTGTVTMAGNRL